MTRARTAGRWRACWPGCARSRVVPAVAYVCAVDLPELSVAAVRRAVDALDSAADAAVPLVAGVRQPLAAAYRVDVARWSRHVCRRALAA